MSKQPSHSGERPAADAAPDSAEKPFDPSHFGRHEFPAGLREELIKAEKPRIDPKFLQDTVPPNRKPVLTEPEPIVTTPRGGFAAPKASESTVDRDAKTLLAVPVVKASSPVAATAADSPSAPPVDTSRTDPTIMLPSVRKPADKRVLVISVMGALLLLLAVGLLMGSSGSDAGATVAPATKPTPSPLQPAPASKPDAHPAPAVQKASERPIPSAAQDSAARSSITSASPGSPKGAAPKTPPAAPITPPASAASKVRPPATATSSAPSEKPRESLFSTVPVRPPAE